ncbi:ecto-NOX disulfide-thiol exchanger 1 [Nephila pilipes]|uniref:Ecto-NOX disulfide-thiol exchanger 1 n=1 Tax=Nephila pilipes TaxID=299642 RepID=A0A8X6TK25_NEPPI|nr:ecto-NOX disulfide-thiol exchanger 1 [Nephila pilipes]
MNFSAAVITARVEEDMDFDLDENNAEENNNEDQPDNEELFILKDKLDATNQQLELTQMELEEWKATNDECQKEILKLKLALEECKKVGKSENYKVTADDRSYFEKVEQKVSFTNSSTQCVPDIVNVFENEISLVVLIAIFLHVHPFGANIDYICS